MYITSASDAYVQQRILTNLLATLSPHQSTSLHLSTHLAIPNSTYQSSVLAPGAKKPQPVKNFFVSDEKVERKEKLKMPRTANKRKNTTKDAPKKISSSQKIAMRIEKMVRDEMERLVAEKRDKMREDMTPLEIRVDESSRSQHDAASRRPASASRSQRRPQSAGYRGIRIIGGIPSQEDVLEEQRRALMDLRTDAASPSADEDEFISSRQRLKSRGKIFSSEPKYGRPSYRNSGAPQNIRSGDKKEMKQVLLSQFELTNVLHEQLAELKRKKKNGA